MEVDKMGKDKEKMVNLGQPIEEYITRISDIHNSITKYSAKVKREILMENIPIQVTNNNIVNVLNQSLESRQRTKW